MVRSRVGVVAALAALRLAGAWEMVRPYAPLEPQVGDRLAQLAGFANLSALAAPLAIGRCPPSVVGRARAHASRP